MQKLCFILCAASSVLGAREFVLQRTLQKTPPPAEYAGSASMRMGYLSMKDDILRSIYKRGVVGSQLEMAYVFKSNVALYCNLENFYKKGHAIENGQETDESPRTAVTMLGMSLGVKAHFAINPSFRWYVGVGPKGFFFKTHDFYPYVKSKTTKNALGFVLKSGLNYAISERVFFDLFADYAVKEFTFTHTDATDQPYHLRIGGFNFGGGLGFRF